MIKIYARDRKLSPEELEQFKKLPNENKRFKFLFGAERLEQFKQYRNRLPEDVRDMNVWIKPFVKGGNEFMDPIEFDEEIKAIQEEDERRAEQRALEVSQETPEERQERLRREELAREEGRNITPIVESDGLEYLGADGKYRVYKATNYTGAHNFALPSSEGQGWCITGSGRWGSGPSQGPSYWRSQVSRTDDNAFYFFMTTPAKNSYCVFKGKGNGRLIFVDNATDHETSIEPVNAKLPLDIAGLKGAKPVAMTRKIDGPFYTRGSELIGLTDEGLNMEFIMVRADISTIGRNAICGTRNLRELKLTSNTGTIKEGGISANIALKTINFEGSDMQFGNGALSYNGNLLALDFPANSNVAPKILQECKRLQRVTLPQNVRSIGEQAFDGCDHLILVEIPSTCTEIRNNAFNGCKNLTIKAHFAEKPFGWYDNIEKHVNKIVWLEEKPIEETPTEDSLDDTNDVNILDVNPKKGEKKEEFLQRFMKETAEEYPDTKQRYAVANSYWERKQVKDSFETVMQDFCNDLICKECEECEEPENIEAVVEIVDEEIKNEEVKEDKDKKEVITFTIQTFKKEALEDLKSAKSKEELDEKYDKWLSKSDNYEETGKITPDQQEAFEDELWEIYKTLTFEEEGEE